MPEDGKKTSIGCTYQFTYVVEAEDYDDSLRLVSHPPPAPRRHRSILLSPKPLPIRRRTHSTVLRVVAI